MAMLSHRNSYSAGSASAAYGFRPQVPSTQQTRSSNAPVRNGHSAEYEAPWPIYAVDWVKWPHANLHHGAAVAIGSFLEDSSNKLQVLGLNSLGDSSPLGPNTPYDFVKVAEADHEYPITKVSWEPLRAGKSTANLLATTGDYLRLWELTDEPPLPGSRTKGIIMKGLCRSPKSAEFTAPVTSMHWNKEVPNILVTASIDTTCTVWDLNTLHAKTHLIAHDKEVFDVAFVAGSEHIFASCGADGSVRMFDLRSLDHSTIIYESPPGGIGTLATSTTTSIRKTSQSAPVNIGPPLLRISPCTKDANLLATFHLDSPTALILDIRQPGKELYNLVAHTGNINAIQWAPASRHVLVSGGDDHQALVWDLSRANSGGRSTSGGTIREPSLAYTTESEINNLTWGLSPTAGSAETVGAAFGKTFQALSIVL